MSAAAWGTLGVLLIAPSVALSRLAVWIDWRVLVAVPLVLSTFTWFVYRDDKRRAEAGQWRVPESTLHLAGLVGGWPGAFLAQRFFRHKIAKGSFQFVFWLVVLLHEYFAVDSLLNWRFTQQLVRFVRSHT